MQQTNNWSKTFIELDSGYIYEVIPLMNHKLASLLGNDVVATQPTELGDLGKLRENRESCCLSHAGIRCKLLHESNWGGKQMRGMSAWNHIHADAKSKIRLFFKNFVNLQQKGRIWAYCWTILSPESLSRVKEHGHRNSLCRNSLRSLA